MMVQGVENWRPHKSTIPPGWDGMNFDDVFEVISTNGKKVKQKDYLLSGALPVVDQGAAFIGGYTDDSENKITVEKPVIVFGDHTKCFKLIDFDFVPGADGTKNLSVPNCIDSTYLYYLCVNLRLPDRGYSRHFSFLRKSILPIAPLNEQKRIVDKIERLFSNLDEGEALLKQVQQQLAIYRQSVLKAAVTGELTKDWREANQHRLESGEALLQRILETRRQQWQGRGKYKEPAVPNTTGLPDLPNGWVWTTLPILGEFGRGKSKHRPRNDPKLYENGMYPFLQTGTVRNSNGRIKHYDKTYNDFGLQQSKLWPKGTICITIAANIAESGILDIEACFPDSVVGLVPASEIYGEYVEFFIRTARSELDRYAPATAQKNINLEILEKVAVPLPSTEEQKEIVDMVSQHLSQIDALETWCATELARSASLRQSILKDAFSGKLVEQDPNDEPASELLKRIQAAKAAVKKAPARKRQ